MNFFISIIKNKIFHQPFAIIFLQIQVGGLDRFMQPGKRMQTRSNFTGCIENMYFNGLNVIRDARLQNPRFQSHGGVTYRACMVISHILSFRLCCHTPILVCFLLGSFILFDFFIFNGLFHLDC